MSCYSYISDRGKCDVTEVTSNMCLGDLSKGDIQKVTVTKYSKVSKKYQMYLICNSDSNICQWQWLIINLTNSESDSFKFQVTVTNYSKVTVKEWEPNISQSY